MNAAFAIWLCLFTSVSTWYSSMRERLQIESIDTRAGFQIVCCQALQIQRNQGLFLYIDPLTFPSHLQWAIGKIIKKTKGCEFGDLCS